MNPSRPNPTTPASGERGAADHPAADLIAAVLAVTPVNRYGQALTRSYELTDPEEWGDPKPIAARQAVAVLRWLANSDYDQSTWTFEGWVEHLADAIEAAR